VHNTYLRQKILMCTEEVAQMEEKLAKKLADIEGGGAPSAPPSSQDPLAPTAPPAAAPEKFGDSAAAPVAPSAPPAQVVDTFKSTECVVCMENKVFFPDKISSRQSRKLWLFLF
jgi:hypothetical protein